MRAPAVVAVGIVGVLAGALTPAWAHPGFRPSSIPAGEVSEIDLVIEHDCETGGGGASPTRSVAVQVPPAIAMAEALPQPGWETASETGDNGRTTVVEWSATEQRPTTPPTLVLRITPRTQTSSTQIELLVAQDCDEGSYLWGGGTPDEPPVTLTITPGVLPEPSPAPSVTPSDATSARPSETNPTTPTTPSDPAPPTPSEPEAEPAGGRNGLILAVVLAVVAGGVIVLVARRPRN